MPGEAATMNSEFAEKQISCDAQKDLNDDLEKEVQKGRDQLMEILESGSPVMWFGE